MARCAHCSKRGILVDPARGIIYCSVACMKQPMSKDARPCLDLLDHHKELWALYSLRLVIKTPEMADIMRREGFAYWREKCTTLRDFTNMVIFTMGSPFGKAFIQSLDASTDAQLMDFYEQNARSAAPVFDIFQYTVHRAIATVTFPRRLWYINCELIHRPGLEQFVYENAAWCMVRVMMLQPRRAKDLSILKTLFNTFPTSVHLAHLIVFVFKEASPPRAKELAKQPLPKVYRHIAFI